MPVERKLWREAIFKTRTPPWHCPSCSGGYLQLKVDSLHYLETSESVKARRDEDWEPDWIRYRFCAMLQCNDALCSEAVSVAGHGGLDWAPTRSGDQEYFERFYPDYVNPSPWLIPVPVECPTVVLDELCAAFVASWGDFPAAANHIRSTVERLLDHLKVARICSSKGKRTRLSPHGRILLLASQNQTVGDLLLAIKWLGNAGSHPEVISRDDIFDALDILELALGELLSKDRERVKKLAKSINKRKGPVGKRSASKAP